MRYSFSEPFKKLRRLANNIPAYLTILGVMSTGNRALFAASLLANILLSQFPAILAYTSKLIVDSLASKGPVTPSLGNLDGPVFLGCVYLSLLLAQYVGQAVLLHVNENLTESFSKNIHLEIIKAGVRLEGLYHFDSPEFHNRRAILESEALHLPMNFLRFVADICSVTVTILGMIFLLVGLHPLIPLLIILSAIPDVLTQKKAHRLIYEGIKETAHDERLRDYYRSVLLGAEYAKEVRLYNLKSRFIDKYAEAVDRIFQIVLPIRRRQISSSLLSRALLTIGTTLPYLWTVGKAVQGEISVGQLVMFMTAIVVIQQQLSRAAQTLAGHQDVNYMMGELASWIEAKPALVIDDHKSSQARKHHLPPQLRIDNLWFKYPGSENFTLKGLDLEVEKGKSLAIVGRNGCGKTTLVKLLCRLYDPQRGAIYFDGLDIRGIRVQDLRSSIGIIFQDFMRYQLSVNDNIALKESDDDTLAETVYQAALTAGADGFIKHLPRSYETLLGKQFPDGAELSGGQWQRLALARAFFRNAGMLILDEPTASLDVATEVAIYAHFKEMTRGKTALLISHRLSTVRIADNIAVIDDGKVVEFGNHESLMRSGGIYSEMFMMQAERYRLEDELSVYQLDVQ
jgi:ATP-binding cassette, subfamily B, bacterial